MTSPLWAFASLPETQGALGRPRLWKGCGSLSLLKVGRGGGGGGVREGRRRKALDGIDSSC